MQILQETFFLPVDGGECFCIWRAPRDTAGLRGLIIHLPPFAEEMNKARRMTSMAARAFASYGFGVLQFDLLGTGDSSGDFGDATLECWVENAMRAVVWARQRSDAELWVWCLRAGALLAPSLLSRLKGAASVLLWQPVVSGKQFVKQFLRLRLASDMLEPVVDRAGSGTLRDRLLNGESLEVAGYCLSPAMASGLERAEFALGRGDANHVVWLEISAVAAPELSPAARTNIELLRSIGVEAVGFALSGPGFWQTVEIEECPQLIAASLAAILNEGDNGILRDPVLL